MYLIGARSPRARVLLIGTYPAVDIVKMTRHRQHTAMRPVHAVRCFSLHCGAKLKVKGA